MGEVMTGKINYRVSTSNEKSTQPRCTLKTNIDHGPNIIDRIVGKDSKKDGDHNISSN